MSRQHYEEIIGVVGFVVFIAAHQLLGIVAAIRVAGVSCLTCGAIWVLWRLVPVAIEGEQPSYFLGRASSLFAGIAMITLGIALLVFPSLAGCLLEWSVCL